MKAKYTQNWSEAFEENMSTHLRGLWGKPLEYLEIGIFEGRSGRFMLDKVLTHAGSRYVGIDCWTQSNRYAWLVTDKTEQLARDNLNQHREKVQILKAKSKMALTGLLKEESFDLAYVDGSHLRFECLEDSVLVYPLVKKGGIIVWDDYRSTLFPEVKRAVDAFLSCVDHFCVFSNHQKGVQKL